MKKLGLILGLLLFVTSAFGQGVRYPGLVLSSGGFPNATIRVCNEVASGTPCSPLANIYSDAALTTPLANPFTGDVNGNFAFYANPAAKYHVQVSGTGITTYDIPDITLPGGSGGGGGGSGTVILVESAGIAGLSADFNGTTPAAQANTVNVIWQKDALNPTHISAAVAAATASSLGVVQLGTDFGGTAAAPQVVALHLTLPCSIGMGCTGQATATAAFDALAPTTLRGDFIYRGAGGNQRLPIGVNGQCLSTDGTDPIWGSCFSLAGGTTNALTKWTSATTVGAAAITEIGGVFASTDDVNFGAAPSLKVPVGAGLAPTVSGLIAYNSTNNVFVAGANGVAKTLAFTTSSITGNAATASLSDHAITSCVANNFVTGQSTAWALTCAQPSSANLSDQANLFRTNANGTAGAFTYNFSGAAHTLPVTSGTIAGKPATCTFTAGVAMEAYLATDASPGQNWFFCTASNTWTQQLNSGVAGMSTSGGNAAATAFPVDINPSGAGNVNLGSTSNPWGSVFIGNAVTNNIKLTGTATTGKIATFPDNTGTVAELNIAQTFTQRTTLSGINSGTGVLIAGAGFFRLVNSDQFVWRNNGNTSDVVVLGVDNLDWIQLGVSGTSGLKFPSAVSTNIAGGSLQIRPTVGATNGGDVTIGGGNAAGAGVNGSVHILGGTGGTGGGGVIDVGTFGFGPTITNDAATGTMQDKLVSQSGAGTAIVTPAGSTVGVIGIAGSGAGVAGSVTVIQIGRGNCIFDSASTPTPGHYAGISATVLGGCTDAGLSPTGFTVGKILSFVSGTTYSVLVNVGSAGAGSTSTTVLLAPSSTQTIQATSSTAIGLRIKQPSGGSVPIFDVQNSAGTSVFSISSTGTAIFGTGTGDINATSFTSASSLPSTVGFLRLASSDFISWRNNGNTGPVNFGKNVNDRFTLTNTPGMVITAAGSSFATTLTFTAPAAAQELTIPDTGLASDTFSFLNTVETFTNKTMGDSLLFTNLGVTPSNPTAGLVALYSKTDQICSLTSGGTEVCFSAGGGGTTAISSLLGAAGANTINNGNNAQKWNVSLTTASRKFLEISENVASTATTNAGLLNVDTIAASTVNTVQFTSLGTANGVRLPPNGFWTAIGSDGLSGFDMNTLPLTQECTNEGATGTTVSQLAKLNTSNQCINLTVSDTGAIEGIVVAQAGITGKALVAVAGQALCKFDGVTVVNDIVVASVTTAGQCHDAGANLTAGAQAIGKVLTVNGGAGTTASVSLNGKMQLGISGTTNQVNVAFANGIATFSLPQSINTTAVPAFNGVTINNTGIISGNSGTANYRIQSGTDTSASSAVSTLTIRGADMNGTGNFGAGSVLCRGGNDASTGTGQAGDCIIQAGQGTAAANKNGKAQIQLAYIKGATYTAGNVQQFTADNTVQDAATSATNFVGVAVTTNGNAAIIANAGDQITVNYDATVSPSAGWFACSSATVAGQVTAQAGACAAGRTVGVIEAGGVGVTSGKITYAHF